MQQQIFDPYSDFGVKDKISSWFINRLFRTLKIIIPIFIMTAVANAASVTLEWDPVSQTIDGYRIFMRVEGQNYDYSSPAWQGKDTICSIDGLESGKIYYFVIRSYKDTLESSDSNEVRYEPPVLTVNAGSDQIVIANSPVTLNGSGSVKPNGSNLSYQWTQTAGPLVDITASDTDTPSFTAPDVPTPTALLFELNMMDETGLSATDSCQVMVYPQGIVDSDNDGITDEDEINIHGTDPGNPDTDGDGIIDGDEAAAGTNPHGMDDIIIDNGGNGTSSSGNWQLSMGSSYYESQSVYSAQVDDTYTFETPLKGTYEVSLWWTYYHNRRSNVPVEIYDGDQLLDTVYVNQLENDAQWNRLGSYNFTKTAKIVVLSEGNGTTNADAVKLTYKGIVDEVIIDNGGNGTSSTNNWRLSSGPSYYGNQSIYSNEADETYTFETPLTGTYEVALWWTHYNNRCVSVPVEIYDTDQLLDTIYVDQLENDAQWNRLGSYDFTKTARIVVVSDGDCTTNADAVKLTNSK
jgi:hypothetical protein